MLNLVPVKVIRTIEMIADLTQKKYNFFQRGPQNFSDKLQLVKSLAQEDIERLDDQRFGFLAILLRSIMLEINSDYFKVKHIRTISDMADYVVEFQNQLKNVYIRYNEEENRVLMHYSPIPTYSNDWNKLTIPSRGLVIDLEDYGIVVYPNDKFYNYLEKPQTQYHALPHHSSFEAAVKLDGSQGILYPQKDGEIRIITKGTFESTQGEYGTKLLHEKYPQQIQKVKDLNLLKDYTITFEILYAKNDLNRIVVAYDEPDLQIIGVRDLKTGKTLSYAEIQKFAANLGFKATEIQNLTLEEMMEIRETITNFEGWVIRYENELFMKIKCVPYLDAHGARFGTSYKAVFQLLKEEKWDDFISAIGKENRETPEKLKDVIVKFAAKYTREIVSNYDSIPRIEGQKDFALYVQANIDRRMQGYMFQMRQGREIDIFKQLTWDKFRDLYEEYNGDKLTV